MSEDTWENLDTRERRDHELIEEYLNEAPVWFGERELKAWMNNSEMMALENQTEKTPELLWMGEKNSHNQNNYEDGMKLEPWIFKRANKI